MNVTAVKVIAGYDHMLLLSDKGEIWSWGAGAHGETGQNSSVRKTVPHPVLFAAPPPSASTPTPGSQPDTSSSQPQPTSTSVESENQSSTTPRTTSESAPSLTPLQERRAASASPTPVNVHGPFVDIGIGRNFSVAINQRGECYTWGSARNGVLGNGQTEGLVTAATKIDSAVSFTKIFVSRDHIIALGSGEGAPIAQKQPEPEPVPSEPVAAPSSSVN